MQIRAVGQLLRELATNRKNRLGCADDANERLDICGNFYRKAHLGKTRIGGFSKGGLS